MPKLVNRAKMTTATTGTGDITLGSAVDGYQSFSAAGVTDGETVRYVIEDGSNWEIGQGTYTATGTTLTRTVLESSNAGAAISLSGTAQVFIGAAGEDLLNPKVKEVTETVYSLTGTDVDPANGTVQTLALTANRTLTESLATGQAVRLLITGGNSWTVTWPAGIEWVDGAAPTLTAKDIVALEKIGSNLIGYYGLGVA